MKQSPIMTCLFGKSELLRKVTGLRHRGPGFHFLKITKTSWETCQTSSLNLYQFSQPQNEKNKVSPLYFTGSLKGSKEDVYFWKITFDLGNVWQVLKWGTRCISFFFEGEDCEEYLWYNRISVKKKKAKYTCLQNWQDRQKCFTSGYLQDVIRVSELERGTFNSLKMFESF